MTVGACFGAYNQAVPGLPSDRFDLRSPNRLPLILDQFLDAFCFVLSQIFYPVQWYNHVPGVAIETYGFHLWTISIEFWASQMLFLSLLTCIRHESLYRRVGVSILISFAIWCLRCQMALFLMGALVCDLELSKPLLPSRPSIIVRAVREYVPWKSCFFGLWVGSMPDFNGEVTPGFRFFWFVAPFEPLWHSLGAVLLVWSVTRSYDLQAFFEFEVFQYFGRISFSVYLMHLGLRAPDEITNDTSRTRINVTGPVDTPPGLDSAVGGSILPDPDGFQRTGNSAEGLAGSLDENYPMFLSGGPYSVGTSDSREFDDLLTEDTHAPHAFAPPPGLVDKVWMGTPYMRLSPSRMRWGILA